VSEFEFQGVRSLGFVLALCWALALQWLRPHSAGGGSGRVNSMLWAINAVAIGVVCGACACTVSRWAQASGVGVLNVAEAPLWVAAVTTLLALDLVSYGWHRANHRIRVLWRFHQVHHSDAFFTSSTALRFHPGELLLSLPIRLLAVASLGAPVEAVLLFEVVFAFLNFTEHGDIDLPLALERRLAYLFVTPALHRRHHSRRRDELNSNYATIFSFWDRLFASFGPSSSNERFRIGLPGAEEGMGAVSALRLPFVVVLRGESRADER